MPNRHIAGNHGSWWNSQPDSLFLRKATPSLRVPAPQTQTTYYFKLP